MGEGEVVDRGRMGGSRGGTGRGSGGGRGREGECRLTDLDKIDNLDDSVQYLGTEASNEKKLNSEKDCGGSTNCFETAAIVNDYPYTLPPKKKRTVS